MAPGSPTFLGKAVPSLTPPRDLSSRVACQEPPVPARALQGPLPLAPAISCPVPHQPTSLRRNRGLHGEGTLQAQTVSARRAAQCPGQSSGWRMTTEAICLPHTLSSGRASLAVNTPLSRRLCCPLAVESLPLRAREPYSCFRTQPRGSPSFWAEGLGLPLCAVELRVEGRGCGLPTLHSDLAHDGVPGRREMRSRLAHQTPALAWVWLSELDSPLEITTSPLIEAQRGQWPCTGSHSKAGRTPMRLKHILGGIGLSGQYLVK